MRTLLTFLPFLTAGLAAHATEVAGRWQGAIELPNGELAIVVTLEPLGEGWAGSIDIPAQGLVGYELSDVAVDGDEVRFAMDGIPGRPTFAGRLDDSAEAIRGSFQQGPQTLTFGLKRTAEKDPDPAPAPPPAGVPGEGVTGAWLGSLDVGPMELRIALELKETADGGLTAKLDSVDQGVEVPVAEATVEGRTLRLAMPAIAASYEGALIDDGSAIEGTWSQGRELPLVLERLAAPFALKRPQEPQPPFPYTSREVTFANEAAAIELAGTLLLPQGEGPFPAVVFVTGSGPQDRDESLMGHRPFRVIADHLARRGVASLRYDDRGVGGSGGDHMGSTVGDFATDAAAALAFLVAQPGVDGDAIGILGHSEGGLTAPKVATSHAEVDFLVLLAPPGEPLDALLVRQTEDVLRLQGVEEELIRWIREAQTSDLALVKDPSRSRDDLLETLRGRIAERLKDERLAALEPDPAASEQNILQSTTPWFRSLMREDPAVYLRQLKVPVLALFGERDIQVAAEVNARILREALRSAGNPDHEVVILPGLNHLFQHAPTGALDEYGSLEETFAPEALDAIASWIAARFSQG